MPVQAESQLELEPSLEQARALGYRAANIELAEQMVHETLLLELGETHRRFITLEEHSLAGGFGSAVVEFVNDRGMDVAVERIGVPNVLVQHAKPEAQRAQFGLSAENVAARVRALAPTRTA